MYVKSESGRGPVWLRELRILCKLCKLWTERRSSRSSRVDLNALITRSCKNREGRSIRKRGGKPATHKHAIFSFRLFFVRAEEVYTSYRVFLYFPFRYRRRTFCPVSFLFSCVPCTCISVHWSCRCSRGCVVFRGCRRVFFSILRALNYRFPRLVFVCSCVASFLFLHIIHDVSSIVVDLVAFHPNS